MFVSCPPPSIVLCVCVQELTDQELFAEVGPCITVSVAEKPRTPLKSSKSESQALPSPRYTRQQQQQH